MNRVPRPGAGIDEHDTPVGLDRAVHDREAESAAAALGRDERLEQPVAHFRRDARSVVRHPERHRPALERHAARQLVRRDVRSPRAGHGRPGARPARR